MSQWTHFLGIVRYDSWNKNVWPEPPDKGRLLQAELELVARCWQMGDVPYGSEGPIEMQVISSKRGPLVILTGDLRDFGKPELGKVVDWMNHCNELVYNGTKGGDTFPLFVRDVMVNCEVEYYEPLVMIEESPFENTEDPPRKFKLVEYPRAKPDVY